MKKRKEESFSMMKSIDRRLVPPLDQFLDYSFSCHFVHYFRCTRLNCVLSLKRKQNKCHICCKLFLVRQWKIDENNRPSSGPSVRPMQDYSLSCLFVNYKYQTFVSNLTVKNSKLRVKFLLNVYDTTLERRCGELMKTIDPHLVQLSDMFQDYSLSCRFVHYFR